MTELTPKQEKFVQCVVSGMTQRDAFRAAYKNRMTDDQVDREASAMLNGTGKYADNPKVHRRYLELNGKAQAQAEESAIADADEVLRYLTSVLRGESRSSEIVIEGQGSGIMTPREMKKAPSEKDRLKAAELIGKRFGLYTEKVQNEVVVPVFTGEDELEE